MDDAQLAFLRRETPRIAPCLAADRPFWSVVIPTRNRADLLPVALASVLRQAPEPERMEVVVVDDCSATDAAREVVERIGRGRVGYRRRERNLGQVGNVNEGISGAAGHWIHVLHDDDWVEPGFYATLEQALRIDGPIGAAMTGFRLVDAAGEVARDWPSLMSEPGVLVDALIRFSTQIFAQPPAIVVRRDVYETLGGYHPGFELPADWEMWQRIASHYQWWYEPRVLASYRSQPVSLTGSAKSNGQNVAEARAAIDFAQGYLPVEHAAAIGDAARRAWAVLAGRTAIRMMKKGDWRSAAVQLAECLRTEPSEAMVRGVLSLHEQLAPAPTDG